MCRTHDEHLLSLKRTILAHTLSTKIAQLLIYSIRTYLSAQKHLTSESQMNESNNNNNNAHEFRTNFDVWLTLLPCVCLVFLLSRVLIPIGGRTNFYVRFLMYLHLFRIGRAGISFFKTLVTYTHNLLFAPI